MKLIYKLVSYLLFFILDTNLNAILDGSNGNFPILLDTKYSFTNYEWARGYVKFNDGFDIAMNETVILDVNQEINGRIEIGTYGTLILERDIILGSNAELSTGGLGYIITNGHTIFFKGNLYVGATIYFVGNISFNGMGVGSLTTLSTNGITATTSNNVSFSNLEFVSYPNSSSDSFISFSTNLPINLFLKNVILKSSDIEGTTIDYLRISGDCRIEGRNCHYTAREIDIDSVSSLYLDFSNTLEFSDRLFGSSATFIMDSSTLIYTRNSPYGSSNIGSTLSWIIKGKSNIKSNGASSLISVSPFVRTFFEAGARLSIDPNTYLMFN